MTYWLHYRIEITHEERQRSFTTALDRALFIIGLASLPVTVVKEWTA